MRPDSTLRRLSGGWQRGVEYQMSTIVPLGAHLQRTERGAQLRERILAPRQDDEGALGWIQLPCVKVRWQIGDISYGMPLGEEADRPVLGRKLRDTTDNIGRPPGSMFLDPAAHLDEWRVTMIRRVVDEVTTNVVGEHDHQHTDGSEAGYPATHRSWQCGTRRRQQALQWERYEQSNEGEESANARIEWRIDGQGGARDEWDHRPQEQELIAAL